ncbi:MAG: flagellar hook assembly protein FlgD [Gammaproteobacteria bacterium]|nr:flagellar hook assembly protein FlgD [Gammaproteobacteria bacterium]MDH5800525.1 flagellar hook assembly protein FlgD [Gammaproteobacteria bacterium]
MSVNDIKSSELYKELGPQVKETKRNTELGQQEFLDLMVAQLRNQDPFKPLENGDFIAQMAQFSAVTGLTELKDSFNELATSLQSNQALQASTLVGRSVLVPASVAPLNENGEVNGVIDVAENTMNVSITIQNSRGELIKRMELGPRQAGDAPFTWNGLDSENNRVPPDYYEIVAEVQGDNGQYRAGTLVNASVESVLMGGAGQGIVLNLKDMGSINFSDVREIR